MSTVLAAALLAIVTQNQVALRAAPRDSATQQATLSPGEVLELRDERGDYLRVYDLLREREGYVRSSQVQRTALTPAEAPNLLAVTRFLRDQPGSESLGISMAAAYIKAAPTGTLSAEPFDAIGVMAERLAFRASSKLSSTAEASVMAQMEVVAGLGIKMKSFDENERVLVCYDGEMFRHVLVMPSADPAQQARAALGLTRHDCVDPDLGPTDRYQYDMWRVDLLDHVTTAGLNQALKARLLMRRAGVLAELAYWQSRRGLNPQLAAERSITDLADVDRTALDADGLNEYAEAAVRVGASRLAAQTSPGHSGTLAVRTTPGRPGETCVALVDLRSQDAAPLLRRCTFSIVWSISASANADGSALVLAVQPLPAWRELWVFRRTIAGWTLNVLPPDADGPGNGYIEAAGWEPNCRRMLVVRESHLNARLHRRFEVVRLDTLASVSQAPSAELLAGFSRWQDPIWRSNTVALR